MTSSQEIAMKIGQYYLKKNNYDFQATAVELEKLRITDIAFSGDKVTISTSRPGLLIGLRGRTIEALTEYLGVKIHLIESSHWLDWLVPVNPADY